MTSRIWLNLEGINVEYKDKSAFAYGFGILPDFRGKGYGKNLLVVIFFVCIKVKLLNIYF
ncbi:MAG TPA: hypothetical protein VF839_03475 [Clostridium sp.]